MAGLVNLPKVTQPILERWNRSTQGQTPETPICPWIQTHLYLLAGWGWGKGDQEATGMGCCGGINFLFFHISIHSLPLPLPHVLLLYLGENKNTYSLAQCSSYIMFSKKDSKGGDQVFGKVIEPLLGMPTGCPGFQFHFRFLF